MRDQRVDSVSLRPSSIAVIQRVQQSHDRIDDVVRQRSRTVVEPSLDCIRWHLLASWLLVSVLVGML
jgi:hypothetical protein